jgi:predicted RNA-binding protein with PIN domain
MMLSDEELTNEVKAARAKVEEAVRKYNGNMCEVHSAVDELIWQALDQGHTEAWLAQEPR